MTAATRRVSVVRISPNCFFFLRVDQMPFFQFRSFLHQSHFSSATGSFRSCSVTADVGLNCCSVLSPYAVITGSAHYWPIGMFFCRRINFATDPSVSNT